MAKDKLTDYDSVASSNLDVGGISVAEGMLPSGVNNAIREQMSHLADFAAGTSGVDVLKLQDDTDTNSIKLQAPASVTATTTFTLPDGDGASGQTMITDGAGTLSWAAPYGTRNLIINGAMQVAQRGTSTSSVITSIYGACDRQKYYRDSAIDETVVTISQSTDAPTGFKYSHKVQVTTAEASIDSDDLICPLHYIIEGQDLQHLSYGTSSAKAMTVSFWVRSNVTGVFSLTVFNNNNSRLVAPTYTISSADTWEYKTLAIPGDQTGTIVNTNGYGLDLYFNAMVGSSFTSGTSAANAWAAYSSSGVWCVGHTAVWGSSTSDYWQITGVQLEVGDTATPFEHRSYGDELARCQRYYETGAIAFDGNQNVIFGSYSVTKRAAPSLTRTGNTYSASEAGAFFSYTNQNFYVTSGSVYIGGGWTADAEL